MFKLGIVCNGPCRDKRLGNAACAGGRPLGSVACVKVSTGNLNFSGIF